MTQGLFPRSKRQLIRSKASGEVQEEDIGEARVDIHSLVRSAPDSSRLALVHRSLCLRYVENLLINLMETRVENRREDEESDGCGVRLNDKV